MNALPVSFSLFQPPALYWLIPAVGLSVLLAWLAYPGGPSSTTPGTRRALRALRGAGWLVVLLLLLAPVLRSPEGPRGRVRVIVLEDRSLSMELPSSPAQGSASRSDVARRTLAALRRTLGSRTDLLVRPFARVLADSGAAHGEAFSGSTALGNALAASGALAAGRPAAVVVLTDGTVTRGQDAWGGATRLGLPVFPVLACDSIAPADAALSQVSSNATAYVGRPAPVRVTLRSLGLAGRPARVELREGRAVLGVREARLPAAGELQLDFELTPQSPGVHFYSVAFAPVPGELTARNNGREFALEVLEDRSRVMLIQASPDFDFSSLRRSLEEEPDLAPEFWTAGPEGTWKRVGEGGAVSTAALEARLRDASVIVLGDLRGAPGRASLIAAVAVRVRSGAGLFVLGGAGGLAGLAGTPLASLMPFDVESPGAELAPASPEPAPEARGFPVLGEESSDAAVIARWRELPPAAGISGLKVRGAAHKLLVAAHGAAGTLVAAWEPQGSGHVLAINTAQLYRWTFTAQGQGQGTDLFRAFLSRAWRWLNEPVHGGGLQVRPSRRVVPLGESVEAVVRGLRPGETVQGEALGEDGHAQPFTVEPAGPGGARLRAELPPGAWRIRVRSLQAGRESSRAETLVHVESNGLEWLETAPDAAGLSRVAQVSGGQRFLAADSTALAAALHREIQRPRGTREVALHRQAWPYLLALLLFGTEWWVRRRRGLP